MNPSECGFALVTGLMLLSLLAPLGLAAASAAQVELQLARNEGFRENARSAASAGLEIALAQVTTHAPESVPTHTELSLGGARVELEVRFRGYEPALPQTPGAGLAGAHFDILSTASAGGGAVDRQRTRVLLTVASATSDESACEPVAAGVACARLGELQRLSWQRLPLD